MALIVCPKCGKQISSSADTCIHCGWKISLSPDREPPAPPAPAALRREEPSEEERKKREEKTARDAAILSERAVKDGALYAKLAKGEAIGNKGFNSMEFVLLGVVLIAYFFKLNATAILALFIAFLVVTYGFILTMVTCSLLIIRLCARCAQWIKREELDVRGYFKANRAETWKERGVISHSLFLTDRPADKTCSFVAAIVPLVFFSFGALFMLLGIKGNVSLIFVGAVLTVIGFFVYGIMFLVIQKHYNDWAWKLDGSFRKEAKAGTAVPKG